MPRKTVMKWKRNYFYPTRLHRTLITLFSPPGSAAAMIASAISSTLSMKNSINLRDDL